MQATLADYTDTQLQRARSIEFVRLVCHLKSSDDVGPRSLSHELPLMHASERVLQRWPDTTSASQLRKRAGPCFHR